MQRISRLIKGWDMELDDALRPLSVPPCPTMEMKIEQ